MSGGGTLYQSDKLHLLRTGMGSNSKTVLTAYLEQIQPERIWNVGLAGALNTHIPTAEIFKIARVRSLHAENGLTISEETDSTMFPAANLLTVPKAVTSAAQRDILREQTGAELVDMEAFYLAEICSERHIPFSAFKMVSDFANHQTQNDFFNNLQTYTQRLARALHPLLIERLS